jgi:hypothetical protein
MNKTIAVVMGVVLGANFGICGTFPLNVSDPKISVETHQELTPYFGFQTTRRTWDRIKRLAGDPEGLAYAGPIVFITAMLIVGALDCISAIGTVPVDVFAAPFRKREMRTIGEWSISGQAADASGHGIPGQSLRIILAFTSGQLQHTSTLGCIATVQTDSAGAFSTTMRAEPHPTDGLEIFIKESQKAREKLRWVRCPNAEQPEGCASWEHY